MLFSSTLLFATDYIGEVDFLVFALCETGSSMRSNNFRKAKELLRERSHSLTSLIFAYTKQEIHVASNFQTQETSTNSNSASSITKPMNTRGILPQSPTPAFHSQHNRSAKSEAHPNALKNIKNYPLLLASLTEAANRTEESKSNLHSRSVSNIDFRNYDLERISKLFGLDDY